MMGIPSLQSLAYWSIVVAVHFGTYGNLGEKPVTALVRKRVILKYIICIIVIMGWGSPGQASAEDIYIIANRSVPVTALSKDDLRDIFLGKKTLWNENVKIVPVIMPSELIHNMFVVKYTRKLSPQFKNWWIRLVFTGEAIFPRIAVNPADMIRQVSENQGAIGYSPRKVDNERVKTLVLYDENAKKRTHEPSQGRSNE